MATQDVTLTAARAQKTVIREDLYDRYESAMTDKDTEFICIAYIRKDSSFGTPAKTTLNTS